MLTLYFSPGSSSMATHIALHEVGVPFEAKLTALHEHKNREPGYLAVNPEGKVPTLMIDGQPLTEVAANPINPVRSTFGKKSACAAPICAAAASRRKRCAAMSGLRASRSAGRFAGTASALS